MYGGGYGGYSSYGSGYGGYSSLGGYGGYGSSYGGYGSSYGGLGRTNSLNTNINSQDPSQPQQQQINHRRQVFQEYFKMMGGLKSMVQIGFAMVALCNFGSKSWKLLKKMVLFLANNSKKLFYKLLGMHVLTDKMGQAFQKAMLISPNSKNAHTLVNKLLLGFRVLAAIALLIGIKLKTKVGKQVQNQHDEILKKYEDIKLKQQKIEQKQRLQEEYTYQKQGYF